MLGIVEYWVGGARCNADVSEVFDLYLWFIMAWGIALVGQCSSPQPPSSTPLLHFLNLSTFYCTVATVGCTDEIGRFQLPRPRWVSKPETTWTVMATTMSGKACGV